MDRSAVKAIVDRAIGPLARALAVAHWRLRAVVGPIEEEHVAGQCWKLPHYEKATIEVDPERHDDEAAVLDTLRHELIHVVISPFDLFRDAALEHAPEGPARAALEHAWTYAMESAARNVERLLDARETTPTPTKGRK